MKVLEVIMEYLLNLSMAIKVTGIYFIIWFTIIMTEKISKIGRFFKEVENSEPKTGYQRLKKMMFSTIYRIIALILNFVFMLLLGSLIVSIIFWLVQQKIGVEL